MVRSVYPYRKQLKAVVAKLHSAVDGHAVRRKVQPRRHQGEHRWRLIDGKMLIALHVTCADVTVDRRAPLDRRLPCTVVEQLLHTRTTRIQFDGHEVIGA